MLVFQIFVAVFLDVSTDLYFNIEQRWIKGLFKLHGVSEVIVGVDMIDFSCGKRQTNWTLSKGANCQKNVTFFAVIL